MIESQSMVKFVARCDGCGLRQHTLADGFATALQAIEWSTQRGWTFSEDRNALFCLACTIMPVTGRNEPCS